MTVQININPETGLTSSGNSGERKETCQLLFSVVHSAGVQGYSLGIPNVLRNAWQLLGNQFSSKKDEFLDNWSFDPHAYWEVGNRPKGTIQIIDSGLFTLLYGGMAGKTTLKDIEKYLDIYIEFVNTHYEKRMNPEWSNRPWFVEIDCQPITGMEEYRRIQNKLLDKCPNKDFIGVWHTEFGMKALEELCEKFDYVSLSMAKGWNWSVVFGAVAWIREHYPKTKIHLLGCEDSHTLANGGLMHLVDTCDCTTWCNPKRFGISTLLRSEDAVEAMKAWTKPAEKFWDEKLLCKFPRRFKENSEEKSPISGWSYRNIEAQIWAMMLVMQSWSKFGIFGYQDQWDKGSFRNIMKRLCTDTTPYTYEELESLLTEPLYETKLVHSDKWDFHIPMDYNFKPELFNNVVKSM